MTTPTNATPLRQRMIEDMVARRMVPGTQVGHIRACKRFAAWLKRSPETATADDLRSFQMHLSETGVSAITRNRTMTGLRFLFRVTLRRLDLLPEMYFIKEPQKVPLILPGQPTLRSRQKFLAALIPLGSHSPHTAHIPPRSGAHS